ncbi:hypothetical protein QR680_005514 [Steinernema hermaphroditum]|uniref:Gamma-soluble NSF attachment protein n=1 Tax=Steinernema hermaphroditum TaxID=289476 RepID=A0AA39LVT3_9BILA|nr:hypothetical protein QR680_005514 [Steinernema hermaphroditum]
MSSANEQRLSEARECIKRADNHLKTSLLKLKLKPDYDSAAMEYERAAVCFKNGNEAGLARDTYLKAADCHAQNRNLFHAGKAKESAAAIARELADTADAVLYYEQAVDLYAESGTMDTAAMAVDKAAKWLEIADPEKAIFLYKKGLAFVQQSDRSRMAGDFLTRITKLHLKLERYGEAAESVTDEIEKYMEVNEVGRVGQLTTGLCLILLANGDSVAAMKAYSNATKLSGFERSEDGLACGSLISAYQSGDNEAFQQCLRRPTLRSMDNEYLRLMKKIKIEDEFSNMKITVDADEQSSPKEAAVDLPNKGAVSEVPTHQETAVAEPRTPQEESDDEDLK